MNGYIRDFADPLDGLLMQLNELRGFARTVLPLIEADRQATWDRVASSPGNPDEDILDSFAREAGDGTGGGFADFGRTAYSAALVLGWEVFRDYLALHLAERERLPKRLGGRHTVRDDLERELTELSLYKLAKRYSRLGVMLDQLTEWKVIREIQFTRNAIVHNLGCPFTGCPMTFQAVGWVAGSQGFPARARVMASSAVSRWLLVESR
jgi:hypothetical protein